MFMASPDATAVTMLPGITRRTLTHGGRMLLVEFTIQAGAIFPEHNHPHEQIGYLCKGMGTLWIGGESSTIEPGTSWCIPENVPHKAEFSEESIAIDIFSPVREDYLDGSS